MEGDLVRQPRKEKMRGKSSRFDMLPTPAGTEFGLVARLRFCTMLLRGQPSVHLRKVHRQCCHLKWRSGAQDT